MAQTTDAAPAEDTTPAPEQAAAAQPAARVLDAKEERAEGLRKAYSNAVKLLREKHRDEFESLYVQEAKALGINYTPKPTPAQKAEEEMARLLQEFPELREKIAPAGTAPVAPQ